MASRMKAKMQSAADAASVAAISQNSGRRLALRSPGTDGTVPAGVLDANNIFTGNLNATSGYSNLSVTSTVVKTGPSLNSVVTFSASVPVVFMKVLGYQTLTVNGTSKASSSLPLYLDFYLTLDVSGSMGLPSTPAEALRMQAINPDNYVQYPTGCTLACHFGPQNSACTDAGTQQYPTNNYCMGFVYSRLSQSALTTLINKASTVSLPKPKPGLPTAMQSKLNNLVDGSANSLLTGNSASLPSSLTAVTSCPTDGTDACIRAPRCGRRCMTTLFRPARPSVEKVANHSGSGSTRYHDSIKLPS